MGVGRLRIYVEPRVKKHPPRISGIYMDLRREDAVSPAMAIDAIKSCGINPKDLRDGFEIIALIDPEKPPRGLDLIASLWDLTVALDLELLRTAEVLRIVQRGFKRVGVKIDRDHLQYSLGIVALLAPDLTIVPRGSRPVVSIIKDLKVYAGATAGKILVEICDGEAPEELSPVLPIIDGILLLPCQINAT